MIDSMKHIAQYNAKSWFKTTSSNLTGWLLYNFQKAIFVSLPAILTRYQGATVLQWALKIN